MYYVTSNQNRLAELLGEGRRKTINMEQLIIPSSPTEQHTNVLQNIIDSHDDLAFVFGNGINYRLMDGKPPKWEDIMKDIWESANGTGAEMPSDISLPEIGDILDDAHNTIHDTFSKHLDQEIAVRNHPLLCKLKEKNIPILTTNYDLNIEKSLGIQKEGHYCGAYSSARWYLYYGDKGLTGPMDGFGVWHIHGDKEHKKTMCVTQSDYITRIKGAYSMLNVDTNKSSSKDLVDKYKCSWLQILLKKSLVFVGLGLGRDEIFLRWLLFMRKKLQQKNSCQHEGWYVYNKEKESKELTEGMKSFLNAVNIEPLEANDYNCIYDLQQGN